MTATRCRHVPFLCFAAAVAALQGCLGAQFDSAAAEPIPRLKGAFDVIFSTDIADVSATGLARFDAVFVNNAANIQDALKTDTQRRALLEFVKNGGGLAAIHAAADGGWRGYTEMLGGRANGSPWRGRKWGIRVEDRDHPLTGPFAGEDFKIEDELFRFKSYARAKLRVLMTIDLSFGPEKSGREDKDNPVS